MPQLPNIYKAKEEDYYKHSSEELCTLLLTSDGAGREKKSLALMLLAGRNKDGDLVNAITRANFRQKQGGI